MKLGFTHQHAAHEKIHLTLRTLVEGTKMPDILDKRHWRLLSMSVRLYK